MKIRQICICDLTNKNFSNVVFLISKFFLFFRDMIHKKWRINVFLSLKIKISQVQSLWRLWNFYFSMIHENKTNLYLYDLKNKNFWNAVFLLSKFFLFFRDMIHKKRRINVFMSLKIKISQVQSLWRLWNFYFSMIYEKRLICIFMSLKVKISQTRWFL